MREVILEDIGNSSLAAMNDHGVARRFTKIAARWGVHLALRPAAI
jgi:hypothetical protein